MQFISIRLYNKMIASARLEGLSEEVLAETPVSLHKLKQLEVVPADAFFSLHEQLANHLGPGFPVRVGQRMQIDDYGVLGLSWRTCSTAGEIFERCERYFYLLSNTYVFRVEQKGEDSHVVLSRDTYRQGVHLSNAATLSASVVVLQAMTEQPLVPIHVSFSHARPSSIKSYEEAFACPVVFAQAQDVITYRTEALRTPTAKADASLNAFLVERVKEEQQGLALGASLMPKQVEQLVREALPGGIPTAEWVGKQVGMSTRTLHRRLEESGLSFRSMVQQTQAHLAKEMLRNSESSISEVAFNTGFSEQSAFSRAFKRWTGHSPLNFRTHA